MGLQYVQRASTAEWEIEVEEKDVTYYVAARNGLASAPKNRSTTKSKFFKDFGLLEKENFIWQFTELSEANDTKIRHIKKLIC